MLKYAKMKTAGRKDGRKGGKKKGRKEGENMEFWKTEI
jgi:hypothetical protein